jgi:glycine/D-amino acid oxidase-like deaminating enzyme
MHVAICGGGVIGAALAYELTTRGARVTLIERWRIAGAASGKSGGFLARDWSDTTPLQPLAELSFDEHQAWADRLGNPYGYRRVETFSAAMSTRRALPARGARDMATWLAEGAVNRARLGTAATTAQLDPAHFTTTLADAAAAGGAEIIIDAVTGIGLDATGEIATTVERAGGAAIQADAVVLALGPWSLIAATWMQLPPVYGLKGHSIILRPKQTLPPEAIFAEFEDGDGDVLTPEIVPRADGTLYICGLAGVDAMPVDPARVGPEAGGAEKLRDVTRALVPGLEDADLIASQACYRPITADGLPLIGPVPGLRNAYVATGHSVWGMLNAPGTAIALSDLMLTGKSPRIDLTPFAPDRLAPLDPADLEMR